MDHQRPIENQGGNFSYIGRDRLVKPLILEIFFIEPLEEVVWSL
jgi:hypothetical protein